jgi:RNA polymerase sigma-70 factor, ECF subfamily
LSFTLLSDEQLMAAAARGDHDAFAEVDRRYRGAVRHALARTSAAHDLVEDALQEAFVALLAAAGGDWSRGGAVPAFLLVVGTRRVAQRHRDLAPRRAAAAGNRENARRRIASSEVLHDGTPHDFAGEPIEVDDLDRWLASRVQSLPPHYREALSDQHLDGLTEAEAGALRGMTPEAVKMLRYRARRRLLAFLAENRPCPTASRLVADPAQARSAPDPFVSVRQPDSSRAPCATVVARNADGRVLPDRQVRLEVVGPRRASTCVLQPRATDDAGSSTGRVASSAPGILSIVAALDPGRLATVRLTPATVEVQE